MTIGERLRTFRKERHLSLRKAAEGADISIAYLSRLEADDGNPSLEILNKLTMLYKVTLEELTAGTQESSAMLELHPLLQKFVTDYKSKFPELTEPDWQRMLMGIRLRGKYPKTSDDWLGIFLELKRSLK